MAVLATLRAAADPVLVVCPSAALVEQLIKELKVPNAPFSSVSFLPSSRQFVTGEDGKLIRLWDVAPLREAGVIGRHDSRVKSVAVSPDGKRVVSAGDDKTIRLWDIQGRRLIEKIGTHTSPVLSVAFSPDGKQIVAGEHDRAVRLYTRHREIWGYRWD
jgi:WD40 repeat protein